MAARLIVVLSVLCLLTANWRSVFAADESKPIDQLESEETTRLIAAELPHWKFWVGEQRRAELAVSPKSLLRWTNPGTEPGARTRNDGRVKQPHG
jgi:hypothetical protein